MKPGDKVRVTGYNGKFTLLKPIGEDGWRVVSDRTRMKHAFRMERIRPA